MYDFLRQYVDVHSYEEIRDCSTVFLFFRPNIPEFLFSAKKRNFSDFVDPLIFAARQQSFYSKMARNFKGEGKER